MNIWEKALHNMQKGSKKVAIGAAFFSDRVKAEIEVARLRIRMDELESIISEQYELIGRKIVDMKSQEELPKTTDHLMKDETIVTALAEIEAREKDKIELDAEIENQLASFKPAAAKREDNPV